MSRILAIFLFLTVGSAYAQPGVVTEVEKDGKRYYEHKVEAGNTLWGLQRMYGVPVKDIVASNPGIEQGLQLGQTVLIPLAKESSSNIHTKEYKVKRQETLYGLSRKFNTSVDQLIELNPELKEGLKKGQVIRVPSSEGEAVTEQPAEVPSTPNPFILDTIEKENGLAEQVKFSFSDSTVRHIVMVHETLYSVSKRFMVPMEELMELNGLTSTSIREGQVLLIPVKQERIERVQVKPVPPDYDPDGEGELFFERKDRYKVIVMLPFYLGGGEKYSQRISTLATQFYMGAQLALDTLEVMGLNADVEYVDTKNDSAYVAELLKRPDFLDADLFIGPFYKEHVDQVAAYCKINKIRMVCPVAMDQSIIENNRLVYQSVQSKEILMGELGAYMATHNRSDNIILVKSSENSEVSLYDAFKRGFASVNGSGHYVESSIGSFGAHMRSGVNNILVIPTTRKHVETKFIKELGRYTHKALPQNIIVYGMKEWTSSTGISSQNREKFNFHYPAPNYIDYYTDGLVHLNKIHRARYKTDLSKMAVHGYDILMYFSSEFFLDSTSDVLMSKFNMQQDTPKSGYVNRSLFIVEQEAYELFNRTNPPEE